MSDDEWAFVALTYQFEALAFCSSLLYTQTQETGYYYSHWGLCHCLVRLWLAADTFVPMHPTQMTKTIYPGLIG